MSGFRSFTIEAIEGISRSSSPEMVWRKVKSCANARGFQSLLILRTRADHAAVLFNDLPGSAAENFDAANFWCSNPEFFAALAESRPYRAAELWSMPFAGRQRRALARLASVFAARDGLIIPIRIEGELEGVVLLGGSKPEMGPVVRSALHLFAHGAFEQTIALENAPPRKPVGLLSVREVECLRWAAAGKTDAEIGEALGISARTARFHFENVKRKLGVATRVQAVTEALRINAIAA